MSTADTGTVRLSRDKTSEALGVSGPSGVAQPVRAGKAGLAPESASLFGRAARELQVTAPSVLVASFLSNLLALALPLTLLQIYDRILPNAAVNTMLGLLIGLTTVVALDVVIRILREALVTHTALTNAFRERVAALAKLLYGDARLVGARTGRYWLDRMMAVEDNASVKGNADKSLFIDLPFVAVFLGMTALVGGWVVIVPIVLIGIFIAVMQWLTARQRVLMEERRQEDEQRYAQIAEWLNGITTIKLLAMETQIYRSYETMLSRAAAYSYRAVLLNNRLPLAGQLFSNLMLVAVSTAGAVGVIEGTMSIGGLACCSLLATRVAQPVFRVVSLAAHMQASELTEARAHAISGLQAQIPAPPQEPLRGAIRMTDVSLPPAGGRSGLRDINLSMEPGDIIGVIGHVHCGKRALLQLLEGSIAPAQGRVTIDGVDSASQEMRAQRRFIQHIDGRIAIFRGTILENITMFRTGAYIAEAVAAVEAIGLDAQINKLPEGFDTRIGDGASALPHGFQQALMIARALAQQPRVLLVSEIGGLLDMDSFRRLERALRHMPVRPTAIFASQRASDFTATQRIYEIRNGRLHALGEIPSNVSGAGASMPGSVEAAKVLTQ